jgi:glycerol-3-phosphate dehydrogenase (NAD(P)+)
MQISILGYGAYGSAVGAHLENNGHNIIKETVQGSDIVFVTVPSFAVLEVLRKEKENLGNKKIIICSKGFATEGELLSTILEKEFHNQFYFLYGPSLASELQEKNTCFLLLAGGDGLEEVQDILESSYMHIELSSDIVGAQVGATLKNIANIFLGYCIGSSLAENTKALVFVKAFREIQNIGVALGADRETFVGPACLGDMYLNSRHRKIGIELGKGGDLAEILKTLPYTPEGFINLDNLKKLAEKKNIDIPLFKIVYSLINKKINIKEAIDKVLLL